MLDRFKSTVGRSRRGQRAVGNGKLPMNPVIEIDGRGQVWSVAFHVDHIWSGGKEGKVRCWRGEDGKAGLEAPINVGSGGVGSIAVSQDGKWIVSGTMSGEVRLWNVTGPNHNKVIGFKAHGKQVHAVDVSPDGTRIATGSADKTACIWSLSTGAERLPQLDPLRHDSWVVTVKFSHDGRLIATAAWFNSIRVYDSWSGDLLVDVPIKVNSMRNNSVVWANDVNKLFVLSSDGNIMCLDAMTGVTLSQWPIHGNDRPTCIATTSDGSLIAASANSTISFWDTTTHQQVGTIAQHIHFVQSMAISSEHGLVTGGGETIMLRKLDDMLPYYDDTSSKQDSGNASIGNARNEGLDEVVPNPEKTIEELRNELVLSHDRNNDLNETILSLRDDLRAQKEDLTSKIVQLERIVQRLGSHLSQSRQRADNLAQIISAHEQRHQCEALYASERIIDASVSLLKIMTVVSEEVRANDAIKDWLLEFTDRCVSRLEILGDEVLEFDRHDEALTAYSTALLLDLSTQYGLLTKWVGTMLIGVSANETLCAAAKFKIPRFVIYQVICDVLEQDNRVTEAIECFRQMQSESQTSVKANDEQGLWKLVIDFQSRCVKKLVEFGDAAMDSGDYNEAVKQYSDALTLHPSNQIDVLLKRSKARALMGSWEETLIDADIVIELDPSSYKGYERKHAALQGMGHHKEAYRAFQMMLSKLEQSSDPHVRELRPQYCDATPTIRSVINQTTLHMPRVLINTVTGRLYDKQQQQAAFEELPVYHEMCSSMTTGLDYARIWQEVKQYYRYVTFSHKWEQCEPSFHDVDNTSVYDLQQSTANIKLQKFCILTHSFGFGWAWADTCCIDRRVNVVLQESLVAMFKWYRGSSLTIVYLRGVWSQPKKPGSLRGSIWNTRAWTYQEYVAAEIVQFYTEDWKPYLDLDMFNHKESPAIISEMHQAAGDFTQALTVLKPGLERVREKLCLASTREATYTEDIAYSLIGVFNTSIPVIYGEGDRAVGRLLEYILTGSGDVTILAWTGRAGSHNSCLPVDLTVYHQFVPPHIPKPMEVAEMDSAVSALRSSLSDFSPALTLYTRLSEFPPPALAASRLRLPVIVFRLTELVQTSGPDPATRVHVYHATSSTLGDVMIKTTDNLTTMKDLRLAHPWIRPLLDQEFSDGAASLDRITQALRLVTRLKQPFGALLFEPLSRVEYRRVAADSLITVQVREEVSLIDFLDHVHTIEVQ